MRWTEDRIQALIIELMEENAIAIRPVLQILEVRFTEDVPTLAVSLESKPTLRINLQFVSDHCKTDEHVKACLLHEFLHIVLGHTERFAKMDEGLNIALDAVINAIIHRTMGLTYSSFFALYYKSHGIEALLRPPADGSKVTIRRKINATLTQIRDGLYAGKLIADDLLDIAANIQRERVRRPSLIGNHAGRRGPVSVLAPDQTEAKRLLDQAVERSLSQMNGSGIFRSPRGFEDQCVSYHAVWDPKEARLERWKKRTAAVLRKHLSPDRQAAKTRRSDVRYVLPVLSASDRRAFMSAMWLPFLPEASWSSVAEKSDGSANIYLDMSGSMNAEMPLIVALLVQLRRMIRSPFWAFSTEVAPARIVDGRLVSDTTGGTSMNCVLKHIAETRPECAVVVTDGYIETIDRQLLARCSAARLAAIVTRDGSPAELHRAGIPYVQLEKVPS